MTAQLITIKCRGNLPGTSTRCASVLCDTDGTSFYMKGLVMELDPPTVICDVCGFRTRLPMTWTANRKRAKV